MGLCEGNYCAEGEKGKDKGNGRIIVMKKRDCLWETIDEIEIPKIVAFTDYSDLSVRPDGKVAITSQEDSAVWIGRLLGIKDGIIDPEAIQFKDSKGKRIDFPKSDSCETVYCKNLIVS